MTIVLYKWLINRLDERASDAFFQQTMVSANPRCRSRWLRHETEIKNLRPNKTVRLNDKYNVN